MTKYIDDLLISPFPKVVALLIAVYSKPGLRASKSFEVPISTIAIALISLFPLLLGLEETDGLF